MASSFRKFISYIQGTILSFYGFNITFFKINILKFLKNYVIMANKNTTEMNYKTSGLESYCVNMKGTTKVQPKG